MKKRCKLFVFKRVYHHPICKSLLAYTEAPLPYDNAMEKVAAAVPAYTEAPCNDASVSGYGEEVASVQPDYTVTETPLPYGGENVAAAVPDYGEQVAAVPAYTEAPLPYGSEEVAYTEAPLPYENAAAASIPDYAEVAAVPAYTEAPCETTDVPAYTEAPAIEDAQDNGQAHQTYLQSSASKPAAAAMAMISMVLPIVLYAL